MRLKRITALFMSTMLVLPTFLVSAEADDGSASEEKAPQGKGTYSGKSEVVYATLSRSGDPKDMYVVNNFTVDKPGKMTDHGPYTSVENLTDMTDMEKKDDRVTFTAKEDEFYYQGNLDGKPLPWNIDVTYKLDGKEIPPEKLLGKDGDLEIEINTSKNDKGDESFFNNYLLQISLTFDSANYKNIEAEDATVANAGKNRQVTFTAIPEKEESFMVNAQVSDLEMEPIEIAATPSSIPIEEPDTEEMKSEMQSLSDATAEVNRGVGELKNGMAELNTGVAQLYDGSAQYKNGIMELNNGSGELVDGSSSIKAALQQMSESVSGGSGDMNMSQFQQLEEGLRQIAGGLNEAEAGLTTLKDNYNQAYQALDQTIAAIPEQNVSEEEIQALYESGADQETVDKLVANYEAAQTTKQTYAGVKEAFAAVDPTLSQVSGSLTEMSGSLSTMADELSSSMENMDIDESMNQLQQGLEKLSANYNNFHSGLTDYTGGVQQLAGSYEEVHGGIAGLTGGTDELENGAAELHNGTAELAESTSSLPDELQQEIDEMINQYDKSDFDPESFVSSENEKVDNVQFVIKTESIKKPDEEKEEPEKEEEKNFWDRLMDLF
ncbi:YhgE/Pip domain-containing protein [Thalassobacillus devorans]|uniref:YhgE/Pip domain-containing protein n=1 Tax=Thalassobacillus devorans TaxID=279813 RepID=UPI0020CAB3EA|nr:YhgE/Pip domain-containing protein [Thalassobacillus devorans]